MHAVIETGSKQYRVKVGDEITIEKLESEKGAKITFPVLLIENGESIVLGKPHVSGAQVTGEILDQDKGPKLIAYTYRRRKGSERKVGHRQPITIVKITDIKN